MLAMRVSGAWLHLACVVIYDLWLVFSSLVVWFCKQPHKREKTKKKPGKSKSRGKWRAVVFHALQSKSGKTFLLPGIQRLNLTTRSSYLAGAQKKHLWQNQTKEIIRYISKLKRERAINSLIAKACNSVQRMPFARHA